MAGQPHLEEAGIRILHPLNHNHNDAFRHSRDRRGSKPNPLSPGCAIAVENTNRGIGWTEPVYHGVSAFSPV
jgi:hypothetical protein